jgi:penicillin-binding protein 1A
MRRFHVLPPILAAAALGAGLVLFTVLAAYTYVAPGLPDVATLKEVRLEAPMRIYTRDGKLIAEFGEKRRNPVVYEQIPPQVVNAFVAAEDDRFFSHPGVDYQGLLRAAIAYLTTGERRQGGSTITMQVARNFLLTSEKTFLRKLREIFVALRIEGALTKQEILTLYLNKIFLGQRAFGVAAAAEVYYGKDLSKLRLDEIATLAGLPKAPSTDNPVTSPERALHRRSYVLRRMLELGYIDQAALDTANAQPIVASVHGPAIQQEASYVAEMVRADMLRRFGERAYTEGFRVRTTLDSALQDAAVTGLRAALRQYDHRHGYRGPVDRRPDWPSDDPAAWDALLDEYPRVAELDLALVLDARESKAEVYLARYGRTTLALDDTKWARRYVDENRVGERPSSMTDVVQPGDVVYVRYQDDRWQLAQAPAVQGAFVAMDPQDGAVVALVGGYEFQWSKFNRAVQARRQPGSSFKPFVYSAALEHGFTPATLVPDAPIVLMDPGMEKVWRPENYTREFGGLLRLREALVKSRNLVSIRVLKTVGVPDTVEHLQHFGFKEEELPHNLSLALGTATLSPLQMASAYTVLANGGYLTEPYYIERIEDATGQVDFEADPLVVCNECTPPPEQAASPLLAANQPPQPPPPPPECEPAPDNWSSLHTDRLAPATVSPQNTFLIADMMRDVIRRGTGVGARDLGRTDLSGKTGTTNDQRDAWFSGFNADLVATTWVGFDDLSPLGNGEVGGRVALPAWKYFMGAALAGLPAHTQPQPWGLVRVKIERDSGLLAGALDTDWMYELFPVDRVPAAATSRPASLEGVTHEESEEEDEESIF